MKENQHTEFKESWHDEYTRYISAFCNTEGGVLYIGIDDKGEVVGIEQPKKLIEKLPNFIAQKTGIMPLIHLREKAGKEYLEIEVQPSAMPISVHGRYYTRSGSVTSELQGNQLNMFLAAKMGLTWESVIEEDFSLEDILKFNFSIAVLSTICCIAASCAKPRSTSPKTDADKSNSEQPPSFAVQNGTPSANKSVGGFFWSKSACSGVEVKSRCIMTAAHCMALLFHI